MHKVSRSLLLAGVMAFGTLTAACGDKVNIVQPSSTAPTGITAITVTPSSATIGTGASNAISLAVAVVADAATPKTVTWTTSSAAVATVDATGKVTGIAAGTATITATATADPSKAAAAIITVAGGGLPTVNTVAISTVNQTNAVTGTVAPANLNAVAGQVDVTLFVSGPAGTVNLIQNCTAGGATSATGDVIVAQQQVAGSQNQSPVTLSYNTAATGTISGTPALAVVNNSASTPIFLNGNCFLKASLGTAVATNITPFTLANVSTYRYVLSTSGTTTTSAANNLSYSSGDLTATITPVNYIGGTIAFISGNLSFTGAVDGRAAPGAGNFPFANVAPAAGTQTFTVTFPSTVVATATVPAGNISQYTSGAAGDVITVTSNISSTGTNLFASATTSPIVRLDNAAPVTAGAAVITQTTNWINAGYTFAGGLTAPADAAGGVGGVTTVIGYAPSSVAALPGSSAAYNAPASSAVGAAAPFTAGQGIGATQCSQTGFTIVATSAAIPRSAAGVNTTYRARAFSTDKLGNVRCFDVIGSGVAGSTAANADGRFGLDNETPTLARSGGTAPATTGGNGTVPLLTGQTLTYVFADSLSGFTLGSQIQYADYKNFSATTTSNVYCATTGCTTVGGPSIVVDNGSGTQAYYTVVAQSVDQAGNLSAPVTLNFLLDGTAPLVQGISIPQNLVGGGSVTFASTATDNVDLATTNFNLTYTAASGGLNLYYSGDVYGTKYTLAGITKTATVNATVPFFIQQVQGTTGGGAPVALTAADSGEAQTVNVRAVDAAGNVSVASVAAIPNINISSKAGFTTGTEFDTFLETNAAGPLNNTPGGTTGTRSTTLIAQAVKTTGGAAIQTTGIPFSQVCFFYQQSAAGAVADPTIPAFTYVSVGCVSAPDITDVAGVSRTWTYRLTGFDPAAALGVAGANVSIIAVGVKASGVGIVSPANTLITVIP